MTLLHPYSNLQAGIDFDSGLKGIATDHTMELTYRDKKRMHNLKYFTWVEQRKKDVEELDKQWNENEYWDKKYLSYKKWDELIQDFNEKTGLLKKNGSSEISTA